MRLERWQAAIEDCSAVLERERDNIKALLRRATAQEKLGSAEAALADAQRVLQLQPNNKEASELVVRLSQGTG